MNIKEKLAHQLVKSAMKKRSKKFEKYFNTFEPTEFQEKVMIKYEFMESLYPRIEGIVNAYEELVLKAFEITECDTIEIKPGEFINKEEEIKNCKQIKEEFHMWELALDK